MSIKRSELFYSEDSRDIDYTPDYRVTQIILNTIRMFGYPEDSLWNIEDKALALMLEELLYCNSNGVKPEIVDDI